MSATEMEMRVAGVLYTHNDAKLPSHHQSPWPNCMAHVREDYIQQARKAIRAMREPTADMCEEVIGMFMGSDIRRMAAHTFQRMIDVASPAEPLPDAPQGALPK